MTLGEDARVERAGAQPRQELKSRARDRARSPERHRKRPRAQTSHGPGADGGSGEAGWRARTAAAGAGQAARQVQRRLGTASLHRGEGRHSRRRARTADPLATEWLSADSDPRYDEIWSFLPRVPRPVCESGGAPDAVANDERASSRRRARPSSTLSSQAPRKAHTRPFANQKGSGGNSGPGRRRPRTTSVLDQRPVNPFFQSRESPARPFTSQAVGQPVPRQPKTALSPLPLPALDTTSSACRGWLFRKGAFAHKVLDQYGVHHALQWRPFYYIADSKSRTLVQMIEPTCEKAQNVIYLAQASISGRGYRRLPEGTGVYLIEVIAKTGVRDRTEQWVLGCEHERMALRWLQVLRACTRGAALYDDDDAFPSAPLGRKVLHQAEDSADEWSDDDEGLDAGAEEIQTPASLPSPRLFDGVLVRDELHRCGLVLCADGSVVSQEVQAAVRLQSAWRAKLARTLVHGENGLLERWTRAIQIQAWARRRLARELAQSLRVERRAAVVVQCLARSRRAWRIAGCKRARRQAARRIQGAIRSYIARQIMRDLQRARRQLILETLQDAMEIVTTVCENHAALRAELARRAALLRVQSFFRMILARRRAERIRRYRAAVKLQTAHRQNRHWKAYHEARAKALRIQAMVRGRAGRVAAHERRRQLHGATTIQRMWRGHQARREYAKSKRAAASMVFFARAVLARGRVKAAKKVRAERRTAAIAIQRNLRLWHAREAFLHIRARHRAARRIQTWLRALTEVHRWLHISHAVGVLQNFWRKVEAQKLAKLLLEARRNRAASCIQRAFRAHLFWCKLETRRQRLVQQWCRPGEVLFRGALRVNGRSARFLRITSMDETMNLSVVVFDGSTRRLHTIANHQLLESGPLRNTNFRTELAHKVLGLVESQHIRAFPLMGILSRELLVSATVKSVIASVAARLFADRDPCAEQHTRLATALSTLAGAPRDAMKPCRCFVETDEDASLQTEQTVSLHPKHLFGMDVERYCAFEESSRRAETLRGIVDAENLVIKAVSDEAEEALFAESAQELRASLSHLAGVKAELTEDTNRWQKSLGQINGGELAADTSADPALAEYQRHEIAYLESILSATRKILRACASATSEVGELLSDVEKARASFRQGQREILQVVASSRKRRARLVETEIASLPSALSLYRICTTRAGQYIAGYLVRSKEDRIAGERVLHKMLLAGRLEVDACKVNAGALGRTLCRQGVHLEQLSGSVLAFNDRVEAAKRDAKLKIHETNQDLDQARDKWLEAIANAEEALQEHRDRFERVREAEEDARVLIDEEKAAIEAYEEHLRLNRPRSKEEQVADLEREIREAARAFDLARRIRRLHLIVETCANTAQRTSFEARQMFIATQRAQELGAIIESEDFDRAEDQCIRIGKRLRTGGFLLPDLQTAFEYKYPELRRQLFTLKDEAQLERGRRHSLARQRRSSGSFIGFAADFDSDSESELSIPEEFEDGKMNLSRAVSACAQDVEYLADLCNEWAELVGEEEAQKRRYPETGEESQQEAKVRRTSDAQPQTRLGKLALAPKAGLQRSYVLYVNKKHRFRVRVLAPALKRANDPFGAKEAKRHEAARTIQRHVRGYMCRRRLLIKAVIRVQNAYRKYRAYKRFQDALFASTAKYYDVISCRYYYVWAGGKVAWSPPEPIADRYIPYGRRTKRPAGYAWTENEAATLVQSVARAFMERRRYVVVIMNSFEKVYEPTRDACFYQNRITGKCQWHKPLGLGRLDLPVANLDQTM